MEDKKQERQLRGESGQAALEYALIIMLVVFAFWIAIQATGPAIGTMFRNTVTNLLGMDPELAGTPLPDEIAFWQTVTWVATQTPQEIPLPTRTRAFPTQTPTDGPSPTPTPTVPTNTPTQTPTPPPSPTPVDLLWDAPWTDSAEEMAWWRLDRQEYIGSDGWYVEYYGNPELSGSPEEEYWTRELDPALEFAIAYDWGSGGPQAADGSNLATGGVFSDNWGAIFRRQIRITPENAGKPFTVDVPITNNGIRVWILGGDFGGDPSPTNGGPGGCSSTGITSGGPGANSGSATVYGDAYPDECLLIDRWRHGDEGSASVTRSLDAGIYTIQVDFYEESGTSRLFVDLETSSATVLNPDDTTTNAGEPICGWEHTDRYNGSGDDANTAPFMWDEFTDGSMPSNTTCHMELRGRVNVDIPDPVFSFWHIWDLRSGGDEVYLQISEYDSNNDGNFVRDTDLNWQTIPLVQGSTANYNWSRFQVDLNDVNGVDFQGKDVTFRFVIKTDGSNDTNRRWYIDDISIDSETHPDLYMNRKWDLNTPEQAEDFITSGRWELTSNKTVGGSGMSWESDPDRTAPDFSQNRWGGSDSRDENIRMHTIEFKGFIDTVNAAGASDLEGDKGAPLLSFSHAIDVRRRMGLEIQYTTDDYDTVEPDWIAYHTISAEYNGNIIDFTRNHGSNTGNEQLPSMTFYEVPLEDIPATRFRLRFAITMRPDSSWDRGWYLDDIQLERIGKPRYLDYPYHDPVEDATTANAWLLGDWGRVEGGVFEEGEGGFAYTDSPNGDYARYAEPSMVLRYPFDVFNDTPENSKSPDCSPAAIGEPCDPPQDTPEEPIMTFYHWREMRDADFYVEWRRFDEGASDWRTLWTYQDRMQTNGSGNRTATRDSDDWERVEIDLKPMMEILQSENDGTPYDDDVIFRFRLDTSGSQRDGIYIDEIRIQERIVDVHYLWVAGETRDDADGDTVEDDDGTNAEGDGTRYYDGLDNNSDLFNTWYYGGGWRAITWEQRNGLYAFHDGEYNPDTSPTEQIEAPPDGNDRDWPTIGDTYNVLEMQKQIDLRGVDASERPIMYFWSRYYTGDNHDLRVQVSYWDEGNNHACRISINQCYEKLYDWSEWETVWSVTGDYRRTYTWQREQVDLSAYAKSGGNDGKRIRVRFVSDALDTATWRDRDGWYIDDISFEHYDPKVWTISKNVSGGTFFDGARNLANWVPEGIWGLSPQLYRGTGGGPASLGTSVWNYSYWDVRDCSYNWNYKNCVRNFISDPANTPDHTGIVLDINNEYGYGRPSIPNTGTAANVTSDRFAARWTLDTATVGVGLQAGDYTLITISDDGVRARYDTIPEGGVNCDADSPPLCGQTWNIINDWNDQGRTVNMGTMRLATGNRYRITIEYYERSSSATMVVTTGANNFSFTDSPKQAAGNAYPEIPSVEYSNSSLILDGVFDMSDAAAPIISYYTYHEFSEMTARVEVTTDGGFTWTQSGLRGSVPNSVWLDPEWEARYYHSQGCVSPVPPLVKSEMVGNTINFNWGSGRPSTGVNADNFSVCYERRMQLTAPMQITFNTATDDGNRLYINGTRVIDRWEYGGNVTGSTTEVLPAGTHTIVFEMFEGGGGAKARLDMIAGDFDNPSYNNDWMPDQGPWRLKIHDLSSYAGFPEVGLRFRLDRQNGNNIDGRNQPSGQYEYRVSWWLTDITVTDP